MVLSFNVVLIQGDQRKWTDISTYEREQHFPGYQSEILQLVNIPTRKVYLQIFYNHHYGILTQPLYNYQKGNIIP